MTDDAARKVLLKVVTGGGDVDVPEDVARAVLLHALLAIDDRAGLCAAVEVLSRRDTEGFMQDALDAARRHMIGEG